MWIVMVIINSPSASVVKMDEGVQLVYTPTLQVIIVI